MGSVARIHPLENLERAKQAHIPLSILPPGRYLDKSQGPSHRNRQEQILDRERLAMQP
jgi:hypothetical protein